MAEQLDKPISSLTVEALMARAAELRRMAATATTADVRDALIRLARRFEDVAARRTKQSGS